MNNRYELLRYRFRGIMIHDTTRGMLASSVLYRIRYGGFHTYHRDPSDWRLL